MYSLLGSDYSSGYGQAGERIHHLAVAGIRLVLGELRKDVTKTKKDGTLAGCGSTTGISVSPTPH